jgi:predicted Fe-Mo cluster-binding NifX family protein
MDRNYPAPRTPWRQLVAAGPTYTERLNCMAKFLITIVEQDIAPRFDLATEVLVCGINAQGLIVNEPRIIILSGASGEDLCNLIIKEGVSTVICGAIEETYHQYLSWKKIKVIDGIIGPHLLALQLAATGSLKPGAIVRG